MANKEVITSQPKKKQGNWWLILSVILLTVLPLIFIKGDFQGADGEAKELITEIQPNYKPWFEPLFEPASGEIESLLFASQAALGAGFIGYVIGFYKGRNN
ncbi:MAG: energy-coupling factor ABC transporter substrate-binding protein [Cyanobacteria bacterium]|nr:energy-coupling factor ABC transporter substrate-binding protein [Cyanobacteria bacterium CG_2015-16_32_12]NCO77632.1 energy-coupling factor ABC transporter substrate-binding protein [Cyanobacteria bacterium CG_2015-22_32_23]NCQ04527.1 energy-coupling factor ABC transporter substrate-binding protein [Cyanobacteria bacterium CG_2015-09_32_10]NCQ41080.1 energy-coupling factor ABC transporter substrate-binding protein [Cyanobacteria bacterium CG_2015-04_32_10]NCS83478.1 energy-coupling factor A